jgi:small-conductance mechanosensitive channel
MLLTRIRPALLAVACALPCAAVQSQDKSAPPPRPVATAGAFDQLARDWPARKGAYEVAYQRFTAQAAALKAARERLKELPPPTGAVPPVVRAADIAPAVKAAQESADAHAERVKRLEAVKAALAATAKAADESAAATAAADKHLSPFVAAAKAGVPADQFPPSLLPPVVTAATVKLTAAAEDVSAVMAGVKADAPEIDKQLAEAKEASAAATARLDALKATQAQSAALLAFEEQLKGLAVAPLADEFAKLRKVLAEKTRAIGGDKADYEKTAAPVAEALAKLIAVRDPLPPGDGGNVNSLDAAGKQLAAAQQYLAAQIRAFDERAEKAAALVAALDEQEKRALAYSTTLSDLRTTAGQLAAVAAEIGARVGRGDLDAAKAPDGLAEAVGPAGARATLDADFAALQGSLKQLRDDRAALRKPDAEAESRKSLIAAVKKSVDERIDLHTDLKRLAADYATARAARPEAEQKRLDQKAAERLARDNPQWDMALALDRSQPSADLAALLSAYYKELVELDEKDENLKRQKEALDKLVRLTEKDAGESAKLQAAPQKAVPTDPLANDDTSVRLPGTAAAKMSEWLAARLSPAGLKAEADTYHAEAARLTAQGGANSRRAQALAADITAARDSLLQSRARGLIILAIKVGAVLLLALILPRLITSVVRRSMRTGTDEAGNPLPALRPVRAVLRVVIWLGALAVVLSILGFDVTAFVIALAVGVLAFALAARPMIADILGSVAVFSERRFKVGDVIRLSGGEPARVVNMTWRAVSLKNANRVVSSVPNRTVAEATVENLTRGTDTYDTLTVTISTDKDAGKVITVIRNAMTQCKNLTADQGVTVVSYVQKGAIKLVQYRFWWFLKDYEQRNKTRDEVFARVSLGLAQEDMTGVELALA